MGAILGSCGGGGVSSDTGVNVGPLAFVPASGTLYANIPFTMTIAGGKKPYFITSSEQTLVPLNLTLNENSFQIIPKNPGVVDVGQDPKEVPARSIRFTVRDNAGTTVTTGDTSFKVLQNFITGYNLSIASLFACGVDSTGKAVSAEACVGSESAIDLRPTTNGVLYQNRALRFSINYGQFLFIDKNSNPPNLAVNSVTLTTSGSTATGGTESGSLRAFLRPLDNARTQYAGMRITDVVSGIYRDVDFVIQVPAPTTMTVLPTEVGPIKGRDTSSCGAGSQDLLLTGGVPPYSIRTSQSITAPSQLSAPGVFTVGVGFTSAPNCLSEPNGVVVTDSSGQTVTIKVTTEVGTVVPAVPLNVFPLGLCLQDGLTASVAVTGGNALKVISSSTPSLVTASPTTLSSTSGTITLAAVGLAPTTPATGTAVQVRVDDGSGSGTTIAVTRKTTCP
jgi:hypothetical protein